MKESTIYNCPSSGPTFPTCDKATPPRPATPDPSPKVYISILRVAIPTHEAIPLFCVTARTCNPNELFCSNVQTKMTTKITKIMMAIRLNGRTTPLNA